jgi:hypothetical protein
MEAIPELKWLVADFTLWLPGFSPGSGCVGFVVDKVPPPKYISLPCLFSFYWFSTSLITPVIDV